MQTQLKQRLIGALVIVVVVVLFVPVLLHKTTTKQSTPAVTPATLQSNQSSEHTFALAVPPVTASSLKATAPISSLPPQVGVRKQSVKTANAIAPSLQNITAKQLAVSSPIKTKPRNKTKARVIKKPVVKRAAKPMAVARKKIAIKKPVVITRKKQTPARPTMLASGISMNHAWVIQVASLTNSTSAKKLLDRLRARGYTAYTRQAALQSGSTIIRVYVGPEIKLASTEKLKTKIKQEFHLNGLIRQYRVQ